MAFKIYVSGNYFYADDLTDNHRLAAHKSHVVIDEHHVDAEKYSIIVDGKVWANVALGELFDETLTAFTAETFKTFYEEHTGFNPASGGSEAHSELALDDGTNPHGTTKLDLELDLVDNVADLDKPISTAQALVNDLKQNLDEKNQPNGYAPVDANRKVPLANMPDSVLAGLEFKGVWDADTNTPTITSGVGNTGDLYKVSVAGITTIDGVSSWAVGDMVIFGDGVWNKIDNTETVTAVHGRIGAIVGENGDYTWKQVLLGGSTATIDQNVYLNATSGNINLVTQSFFKRTCAQDTLIGSGNKVHSYQKGRFTTNMANGAQLYHETTLFVNSDGAVYDANMIDGSLVRKEWVETQIGNIIIPSAPEVQTQSPIVIDGVTTAPTKGTVVQDVVQWLVNGDKVHCKYRYGQSGNGANGSGYYLWKLPEGLSFNPLHHTFVTSTVNAETYLNNIGRVIALNTQNNWKAEGVVVPYDSTHFRVLLTQQNNSSSSLIVGSTAWTLGSKPYFSIEFDFWT